MPTSSQALILQMAQRGPPPAVGRRHWTPGWLEETPLTHIDVRRPVFVPSLPKEHQKNSPPLKKRTATAPYLDSNVDFATLPGLLRIQGLQGSMSYDEQTKSLRWKISSSDPVSDMRRRNLALALAGRRERGGHPYHKSGHGYVHATDLSDLANIDLLEMGYLRQEFLKPKTFVKLDQTDEVGKFTKVDSAKADYFKLVKINKTDTFLDRENCDDHILNEPLYRLIKCSETEAGAIRLAPTEQNAVGEYHIVPPDGYESDDFRLVTSNEAPGCFRILQSDPMYKGSFKPVDCHTGPNDEFRMVLAKSRELYNSTDIPDLYHFQTSDSFQPMDRYTYYDEVIYASPMTEIEEEASHSVQSSNVSKGRNPSGIIKLNTNVPFDIESKENDSASFRVKYDLSDLTEPAIYDKLVDLGFRRINGKQSRPSSAKQKLTAKHEFDQWSSNRDIIESDTLLTPEQESTPIPSPEEQLALLRSNPSLLDQATLKSTYKQWKKKKLNGVRMRAELPPSEPKSVVLCLKDNSITHERLKSLIDRATGGKRIQLQFDPVSVHSRISDAKSQWILKFADETPCELLLISGITVDDVNYKVRRYDDVMREEHEAYKFDLLMKEIKEKKLMKISSAQKSKNSLEKKTKQVKQKLIEQTPPVKMLDTAVQV